ncbi:NUDIX hydrolase [Planococcus glaciei]|uniref:NUDIX hydrolase n=1 Tax=Planococcus glaciei TaxID=459472 RepID=A0A1G8ACN1_9BACL|nr:NUDIX hydrolase [Planococcus glaciei]MBX0313859.1 NUDIX hydrolase [Planococcus glaciei]QDY46736.1 NUDIX hydrolase [Planococcus glaciei]QKX52452.1 NUDIX hydrolase [Planococcus glaciei]SDH18100.1 ADP-ribose pyrophosphatase [Planococcus glaciei]
MKKFEEKTISSNRIYEGKIINLKVDEVSLPNGNTSKRELVEHPGAVALVALTPDKKIILVEQYRKALERTIVEIPAGKIEKGEAPEVTALRELEEETGYTAEKLDLIQSFSTSPGFADEIIHLYAAEGLSKATSGAVLDDDEFVELMEVSIEEAEQMMKDNRIYDAKTAFAVLWAKQKLAIEN